MKKLTKDQIIKVIHIYDEIMNNYPKDTSVISKPTDALIEMYDKKAELIQSHWNDYSSSRKYMTTKELSQMIINSTPAENWMITINCKSTNSVGYGIRKIEFSRYKIVTYTSNKVGKGYFYLTEKVRSSVSKILEQLIPIMINEINHGRVFAVIDF